MDETARRLQREWTTTGEEKDRLLWFNHLRRTTGLKRAGLDVFGLDGTEIILMVNAGSHIVHCGSCRKMNIQVDPRTQVPTNKTICNVPFREKSWWEEEPGSGKIWRGYEFYTGGESEITCKTCLSKIKNRREGRMKSKKGLADMEGCLEHKRVLPAWGLRTLDCFIGEHDIDPNTEKCRSCEITRETQEVLAG